MQTLELAGLDSHPVEADVCEEIIDMLGGAKKEGVTGRDNLVVTYKQFAESGFGNTVVETDLFVFVDLPVCRWELCCWMHINFGNMKIGNR